MLKGGPNHTGKKRSYTGGDKLRSMSEQNISRGWEAAALELFEALCPILWYIFDAYRYIDIFQIAAKIPFDHWFLIEYKGIEFVLRGWW